MYSQDQSVTIFLFNLVALLEKADESFLTLAFKEIELGSTVLPFSFSTLPFYRSLIQAVISPLSIWLSLRHSRAKIIGIGAIWWSISTLSVAISPSFWVIAIARAANGIGLAVVLPLIQSTISDSYPQEERGKAFGMFKAFTQSGLLVGGIITSIFNNHTVFGIIGWRLSCYFASFLSAFLGFMVLTYAKDPSFCLRFNIRNRYEASSMEFLMEDVEEVFEEIEDVISVKSFRILVLQSVFNNFVLNALTFLGLWYRIMGFSEDYILWQFGLFSAGMGMGFIIGGYVGDRLSWKSTNAGRILCSQFSTGVSIPLLTILFLFLPKSPSPSSSLLHSHFLFLFGMLSFWGKTACSLPLFTETVSSRLYTCVFAIDFAFEKVLAIIGGQFSAFLARLWFGFSEADDLFREWRVGGKEIVEKESIKNVMSLSKSLFLAIALPSTVSILLITALYWTYPKDRELARIKAWVEESSLSLWDRSEDDGREGLDMEMEMEAEEMGSEEIEGELKIDDGRRLILERREDEERGENEIWLEDDKGLEENVKI